MGVIIVAYYIAMCITCSASIFRDATWQLVLLAVMLVISNILGAVASFLYFVSAKNIKALPVLIVIASLWGIVRLVVANYEMIRFASQYLSLDTSLNLLLKICIYLSILYQTYV